jgi:hypothetical protein
MRAARRTATIAAIAALSSTVLSPASPADAGGFVVRRVCHGPARVFDTPGGIVIAFLATREPVRVIRHAAGDRRWVRIRARLGISGWMRARALCR